jgi:hypothetical protein
MHIFLATKINLRLSSRKKKEKKEIRSFPQSSGCSTFALSEVMIDTSENVGENSSHFYDPKTFLRNLFPMSPRYSERMREKKSSTTFLLHLDMAGSKPYTSQEVKF